MGKQWGIGHWGRGHLGRAQIYAILNKIISKRIKTCSLYIKIITEKTSTSSMKIDAFSRRKREILLIKKRKKYLC